MKAIIEILQDLNDAVLNGDKEALPTFIELKGVEKLLKQVLTGMQDAAIDEAERYGKGEHELNGAKFQVKNAAGRWDYKECKEWADKKDELGQIEEALKALYKARHFGDLARVDDGEVMELPKYSQGKTTIAIKL